MSGDRKDFEDYSPLESQIDIVFDAYCDCCNADFIEISHEHEGDFLAWVEREAGSARRYGWTEKEDKVFCPNCDWSDFLKTLELKQIKDAQKAKAAVAAVTTETWIEKLKKQFRL